jgi:hypothetical protein
VFGLQIDLIPEFVLRFELTLIQCNFFYLQIFEKVLLDLYCVTPLYEILFEKKNKKKRAKGN